MKWLRRLLKGIAFLLILLLLAAVGFREWCAWRLPRMRREVNDAWRDYAGVTLDDVPKRFPPVEINDATLQLEKSAAKLGICLAPGGHSYPSPYCPRNAPGEAAIRELNSLTFKDNKGEVKSLITAYLDRQMERTEAVIEPLPHELQIYLHAHHDDLAGIRLLLKLGGTPRWAFEAESSYYSESMNLFEHYRIQELLAIDALSSLKAKQSAAAQEDLLAMGMMKYSLLQSPMPRDVTSAIDEQRLILMVSRFYPDLDGHILLEITQRPDWPDSLHKAEVIKAWTFASSQYVNQTEVTDTSYYSHPVKECPRQRLWIRAASPWLKLSLLQMTLVTIRDGRLLAKADRCRSIDSGLRHSEDFSWYNWPSPTPRHPSLSWWNPNGADLFFYHYGQQTDWEQGFWLDRDAEFTDKVRMLNDSNRNKAKWVTSIPGIETSICKNEKWNYTVKADGSATVSFSGKPYRGIWQGNKVALQRIKPAPGHSD